MFKQLATWCYFSTFFNSNYSTEDKAEAAKEKGIKLCGSGTRRTPLSLIMALPTTFQKYTIDIENSISRIPDKNVLFWGAWFCEYLFHTYGKTINTA